MSLEHLALPKYASPYKWKRKSVSSTSKRYRSQHREFQTIKTRNFEPKNKIILHLNLNILYIYPGVFSVISKWLINKWWIIKNFPYRQFQIM